MRGQDAQKGSKMGLEKVQEASKGRHNGAQNDIRHFKKQCFSVGFSNEHLLSQMQKSSLVDQRDNNNNIFIYAPIHARAYDHV